MTEREIHQRVDRMLLHLDRLLLNRDMSEDDYHAAVLDLSRWEEETMQAMGEKIHETKETPDVIPPAAS
jgi:hypothetical protein